VADAKSPVRAYTRVCVILITRIGSASQDQDKDSTWIICSPKIGPTSFLVSLWLSLLSSFVAVFCLVSVLFGSLKPGSMVNICFHRVKTMIKQFQAIGLVNILAKVQLRLLPLDLASCIYPAPFPPFFQLALALIDSFLCS